MNYENYFSGRARSLKPAKIREVLSLVKRDGVIPMAGGMPNPTSFPIEKISDIAVKVLEREGTQALQYGSTMGYELLRKQIAIRYGEAFDVNFGPEEIMITAGSSEAIFLGGRVFLEAGDNLVLEAPTYGTAIRAFDNFNPNYVQIPLDEDGMKVDLLEKKLRDGLDPKLVYLIPSFQNPTGVTMSKNKRERLLSLASEFDFLIMEDGPYNDLRYEGKDIEPIISIEDEGRTLFLGTFSKILAPGFRLGWVMGNKKLIRQLEIVKQSVNLCSSVFSQYIAYEYLNSGEIDKHLPRLRTLYAHKQQVILEALKSFMPPETKWTHPKGGMFIWITLPEGIDAEEMLKEAVRGKVVYLPGYTAYACAGRKNTLRLNYSYPEDDQIRKGVKDIANLIKRRLL